MKLIKMTGSARALSLLLAASLLVLGSCGKKDVEFETASSTIKPEGHLIGSSGSAAEPQGDVTAGDLEPLNETGVNPLAADTSSDEYKAVYGRSTAPLYPVFFDFDSSAINANQLDKLNSSGAHLLDNSSAGVIIEGNCDTRGTADYNLALGELRALNVKKYLMNLGVDEQRLSTISYGSERPLYPGSDEDSHAMNRRADLVLP